MKQLIAILLLVNILFANDIIQHDSQFLPNHAFKNKPQLDKFNGDVTESMMSKYFKGSGWGQINGEVGVNGIDGLFIKKDKNGNIKDVLTVESKYNKSALRMNKNNTQQMSKKALIKQVENVENKVEKDIEKLRKEIKNAPKKDIKKLRRSLIKKESELKQYKQIKNKIVKDNYRSRLFKIKPTNKKDEFEIIIKNIEQKGDKGVSVSDLIGASKHKAHKVKISLSKNYPESSYEAKLQRQLKGSIKQTKASESFKSVKRIYKKAKHTSSKEVKIAVPIVFKKKGKKVLAFMSGNIFKKSNKLAKKMKFIKNVKGGDIVMMAITGGTVVYSVLKGGASFKALSGVLLSKSSFKSLSGFVFEKGIAYLAPPPAIIITIVGSIVLDYAIDKYVELNKRNYIGIEDLLWDVPDEVKNRITVLNLEDAKKETIFDFGDVDKDTILDEDAKGESILDDESSKKTILDY